MDKEESLESKISQELKPEELILDKKQSLLMKIVKNTLLFHRRLRKSNISVEKNVFDKEALNQKRRKGYV